jgi:hypothetical protein
VWANPALQALCPPCYRGLPAFPEGIKAQWVPPLQRLQFSSRSGSRRFSSGHLELDSLCRRQGQEGPHFCSRGWLEIMPLCPQPGGRSHRSESRAWRLAPWPRARLRPCRLKAGCASPPWPGHTTHRPATPRLQRKSGRGARLQGFIFMSGTHPSTGPAFCFQLGAA